MKRYRILLAEGFPEELQWPDRLEADGVDFPFEIASEPEPFPVIQVFRPDGSTCDNWRIWFGHIMLEGP